MTDWKNCDWKDCPITLSNLRVEKDLTDGSDEDPKDDFRCFNFEVSIINRSHGDLSFLCKNVYCLIEGENGRYSWRLNRALLFKEEPSLVHPGKSIRGAGSEYLANDEEFKKIFVEVYVRETGDTYRETFLIPGPDNYIPWKIEKAHCD